ncbi:hypothetical protein KIKIMORA_02030 [Brevundimonas phage vB_BpoS-Kikimora]|uniref:Uncharacterized protein n=1 Tax=Brevundimonas phage vB_BpoS-Kikimora TaxID=2948601 RepID=A0A9E7MSN3_9CAUD|nr:hypothetical protein KIKIMORA_02030 [Brevundimonas phage vB_BpoS-Kikimora]
MGRMLHSHVQDRTAKDSFSVYADDGRTRIGSAEEDVLVAACGERLRVRDVDNRRWNRFYPREESDRASCPACHKRLGQRALKNRPSLELVGDPEVRGVFRSKSGSWVRRNGETIALVAYEDRAWRVYPLTINARDDAVTQGYLPLAREDGTASRSLHSGLDPDAMAFKAKELAALACEDLHDAGRLNTEAELREQQARIKARNAAATVRREQRMQAQRVEKDDTLAALNEILETESLSNFQRQGLMTAIAWIEKREVTGYVND